MDKEKFGLFAINLNCKVTNDVKKFEKMAKIPCSIGFKNKDNTWVNEWVDLIIFDTGMDISDIAKGDKLKVSGRMSLGEWTNKAGEKKKSWSLFVDELSVEGSQPF
jgi:hypothetical protein